MSLPSSWLLLLAMVVVCVGLTSLVKLVILALSDTETVRRINGWAAIDLDDPSYWPQSHAWRPDR